MVKLIGRKNYRNEIEKNARVISFSTEQKKNSISYYREAAQRIDSSVNASITAGKEAASKIFITD